MKLLLKIFQTICQKCVTSHYVGGQTSAFPAVGAGKLQSKRKTDTIRPRRGEFESSPHQVACSSCALRCRHRVHAAGHRAAGRSPRSRDVQESQRAGNLETHSAPLERRWLTSTGRHHHGVRSLRRRSSAWFRT